MAQIDLASNSALLSVAEKLDTQNAILMAKAGVEGFFPITDWSTVQSIVRMGLASKVFSVGDSFTCNHGEFGTLTWDIVGIDCDTPADKTKKHSLTLMLQSPCVSMPFSAKEALLYCSNEIPAGTYYFILRDKVYNRTYTYHFTTTVSCCNPNIIYFDFPSKKITIYSDPLYASVLETVSVSNGQSGTFLGTTDGSYLNYGEHTLYGNENWKCSDIRQWLSSDKENWNEYSMDKDVLNPSFSSLGHSGFLKMLDQDFVAVLGKVVKRTNLNHTIGGYVETEDAVFLPSLTELYCTNQRSGWEGDPYPYFTVSSDNGSPSDGPDSGRTKKNNGYPVTYMTRSSPVNDNMGRIWLVGYDGTVNSISNTSSSSSIVPMCCIV